MKGFIEATVKVSGLRLLISINDIQYVEEYPTYTHICLSCAEPKKAKNPWISLGLSVTETYSEIIEKIAQAST